MFSEFKKIQIDHQNKNLIRKNVKTDLAKSEFKTNNLSKVELNDIAQRKKSLFDKIKVRSNDSDDEELEIYDNSVDECAANFPIVSKSNTRVVPPSNELNRTERDKKF